MFTILFIYYSVYWLHYKYFIRLLSREYGSYCLISLIFWLTYILVSLKAHQNMARDSPIRFPIHDEVTKLYISILLRDYSSEERKVMLK